MNVDVGARFDICIGGRNYFLQRSRSIHLTA